MPNKKVDESEIKEGEIHPSGHTAFVWYHQQNVADPIMMAMIRESIASTALSGNRLAQICAGTIDRIESGKPVSDRYVLGLCWFIRDMIEHIKAENVPAEPEPAPAQTMKPKEAKPSAKVKKNRARK